MAVGGVPGGVMTFDAQNDTIDVQVKIGRITVIDMAAAGDTVLLNDLAGNRITKFVAQAAHDSQEIYIGDWKNGVVAATLVSGEVEIETGI